MSGSISASVLAGYRDPSVFENIHKAISIFFLETIHKIVAKLSGVCKLFCNMLYGDGTRNIHKLVAMLFMKFSKFGKNEIDLQLWLCGFCWSPT